MITPTQVAEWLLQINAIKLSPQNPFTWASGLRSPIYCDNRITLSYPVIRKQVMLAFAEKSKRFPSFDSVAGVATAGIPHGVLLAHQLEKPFVYVRSQAKAHGRQNQIEGKLEAGQKVLVIEDLISTGGSSLQAVETVREAGVEVVGVLAIFSYGFEKATQAFQAADCAFDTLTTYATLLEVAVQQQRISTTDLNILQEWRNDPRAWSAKFERS